MKASKSIRARMRRRVAIVVLSGAVPAAGILVILNALKSPGACLCCYTLAGSGSPSPMLALPARVAIRTSYGWLMANSFCTRIRSAGGAEADPLAGLVRVGPVSVVSGNETRDIFKQITRGRAAGEFMEGHGTLLIIRNSVESIPVVIITGKW